MNISLCLEHLRPGAQWALTANDYSTLEWIGPGTAPTLSEIETAWVDIQNAAPPAPEATPLQVRAFLIRQSISLGTIPALIASAMPEGDAREEALMRWEYALSFPKDYPLVVAVATSLNIGLDRVWADILSIE